MTPAAGSPQISVRRTQPRPPNFFFFRGNARRQWLYARLHVNVAAASLARLQQPFRATSVRPPTVPDPRIPSPHGPTRELIEPSTHSSSSRPSVPSVRQPAPARARVPRAARGPPDPTGKMRWFTAFVGYLTPSFLILSPILSYSDQAMAMRRNKSSAGFSLDTPLIMLVASLLKSAPSPVSCRACDDC